MPIYEYWCPECRTTFEKLRTMESKDAAIACPDCGTHAKKMLSVTAAVGKSTEGESYASGGGCACGGNCGCGGHHGRQN